MRIGAAEGVWHGVVCVLKVGGYRYGAGFAYFLSVCFFPACSPIPHHVAGTLCRRRNGQGPILQSRAEVQA